MITQIQAWLSKIPWWISLPVTTFFGSALSYVMTVPQSDLLKDIMTSAGLTALVKGMVAAGLVGVINLLKPATKVESRAVQDKLAKLAKAAAVLLVCGVGLFGGASLAACHLSPPPSSLPPDLLAEAECVGTEILAGDTDIGTIATKCTKGEIAIAVDLVDWLISDLKFAEKHPDFVKEHPDALPKLRSAVDGYWKTHTQTTVSPP